ncbi:MAG: hypothetical protein LM590_14765 [Thermofilum sp.]|jgi:hypothetical protein|nr:hypothetical protein [Thermofilum sp.]
MPKPVASATLAFAVAATWLLLSYPPPIGDLTYALALALFGAFLLVRGLTRRGMLERPLTDRFAKAFLASSLLLASLGLLLALAVPLLGAGFARYWFANASANAWLLYEGAVWLRRGGN